MFTGLIQETGKLQTRGSSSSDGFKIRLERPRTFDSLRNGESIAVDGVCLTLTEFDDRIMEFFVGAETLAKTNFTNLREGQLLNLERSLALGDRLGGHMVSGHVDGKARVVSAVLENQCMSLKIALESEDFKYILKKGSLCLNGVSLTINEVDRELKTADFYLIPETLSRTNLKNLKKGDEVNVECDQVVKIIAHQLENYKNASN